MKRYKNREQILKDIDRAHAKIAAAKKVAQGFLDEEELLTGTGNVVELRAAREAADKQFLKIKRLQTVRLPKLGEKLAEMDTLPLAGVESSEKNQSPLEVLCEWAFAKVSLDELQKESAKNPSPELAKKVVDAIHAFGKASRKKKKLDASNRHTDHITLEELGLKENGDAVTPPQTAPESPSSTASKPPTSPSA